MNTNIHTRVQIRSHCCVAHAENFRSHYNISSVCCCSRNKTSPPSNHLTSSDLAQALCLYQQQLPEPLKYCCWSIFSASPNKCKKNQQEDTRCQNEKRGSCCCRLCNEQVNGSSQINNKNNRSSLRNPTELATTFRTKAVDTFRKQDWMRRERGI